MGRKPKFTKFEKITVYGKEFKRYPDPKFEAYYAWEKYKYSPELKRDKYVIHIIFPDKLRISKFKMIFVTTEYVQEEIARSVPGIDKSNSAVYTILDFQNGISFWVDIGMINFSFLNKERVVNESKVNIQLGHLIGLFNPKDYKSIQMISYTANKLFPEFKKIVVTSLEDAYKEIDELNFFYD